MEFFDPSTVKYAIHIVGVGAIGSTLLRQLVRTGVTRIHIWDFDRVEGHNIANQQYNHADIGKAKVDAAEQMARAINPDILILQHGKWEGEPLHGYIFLAVDSIELRHAIVLRNKFNPGVIFISDFRMSVESAQIYAADWRSMHSRDVLLNSMAFSDAEAREATPINACGMALSIMPTIESICAIGVANFIKFLKTGETLTLCLNNTFEGITTQI